MRACVNYHATEPTWRDVEAYSVSLQTVDSCNVQSLWLPIITWDRDHLCQSKMASKPWNRMASQSIPAGHHKTRGTDFGQKHTSSMQTRIVERKRREMDMSRFKDRSHVRIEEGNWCGFHLVGETLEVPEQLCVEWLGRKGAIWDGRVSSNRKPSQTSCAPFRH